MAVFTGPCFNSCPAQWAANASWHISVLLFQVVCQPFGVDMSITRNSSASILNPVEIIFKDEPL